MCGLAESCNDGVVCGEILLPLRIIREAAVGIAGIGFRRTRVDGHARLIGFQRLQQIAGARMAGKAARQLRANVGGGADEQTDYRFNHAGGSAGPDHDKTKIIA